MYAAGKLFRDKTTSVSISDSYGLCNYKYIVDFYCAEAKLIVELDGSQHYEDKGMEYDTERTIYLAQYGVRVVRIPNNEVNQNFSGVCEYIDAVVKQSLSQLR